MLAVSHQKIRGLRSSWMSWMWVWLVCFGVFGCRMSEAAVENPQVMIQNMVLGLQQDIEADKASLKASPQKLFALVKRDVMPRLDVNYMGALTVGPLWRASSPEERARFIDQFGLLLTRAYSSALLKVTDYQLTFKPLTPGWESKQFISVSGTIQSKSGGQQPSSVVYYLVNVKGQWKIYDFVVDGISFLQNYRAQFQSFESLGSLTTKLIQLNEEALRGHRD